MLDKFFFLHCLLTLIICNRVQFMKNVMIESDDYILLNYSLPNSISSYDETLITQSIEFRLVSFIIIAYR